MNKNKNYFLVLALSFFTVLSFGQTADEIVDGYYEATGGKDAWSKVENLRMNAKVNQGGMEIPLEIVSAKGGKTYTKVSFQGLSMMQGVYDGETLWSTNFQTQKAEKAAKEDQENFLKQNADFPDALLEYKKNGYTLELMGNESFDGTDAHKLKLTKKPLVMEGNEVDNVQFYFFDTETMILLGTETAIPSGPMKGKMSQTKFGEYDEVDGMYFPFSISQGLKGAPAGQSQAIVIEKVEMNVDIDESIMMFPGDKPMAPAAATQPTSAPTTAPTSQPTSAPTSQPSGNNK